MHNTVVIKPSMRRVDLDSYDDILNNVVACSFATNINKVLGLRYIIVTDGIGRAASGEITNVIIADRINPNGMGRVDITFDKVRESQNLFEDIHSLIE